MRKDGRSDNALRRIKVTKDFIKYAEGSCLFEAGNTKVICTASVEEGVPVFLKGKGSGWVTAEYAMLPRSCKTRVSRESSRGKVGGRTQEIQRLIGRCMRSVTNLKKLGERTIWMDCDVLQADGGTRCASICGSFIALILALEKLREARVTDNIPVNDYVAAISVGMQGSRVILDLSYDEDSTAEVDMNIVMTGKERFIEIQGTAEREPFNHKDMQKMIKVAGKGIRSIVKVQKKVLKGIIEEG